MSEHDSASGPDTPPPSLDLSVPHSARVWNYWLGGKDNYEADRIAGDGVLATIPDIPDGARAERAFLTRVVRYLVEEAGIRQFLDIGTGLPTADNTHEVAQRLAPESTIVYVDNDPLVMVHARALLTSTPEGTTDYIEADLREPEAILAKSSETLDFDRPIGLMLLGVVNHVVDDAESYDVVSRLVQAMPPGSHLVLTHSTAEIHGEPMRQVMREMNERGGTPICARDQRQIEGYFDGTELLEPGVVTCSQWRPEDTGPGPLAAVPDPVYLFGGVGRID
ncbi:SAM-dependent methyltransferase [Streptomonospora wellingtoniae]|uniref:SAM-dependent methyltransferase n=1 Tax=Streptomonospora wellingtoniae TaxID=3075544 RepID=A0ABU2KQ42_9ACTN|nr:SAM-dependent methyltransferase [Streptomonospora sp. DSM 45055]MDT0301389.1 SAM-dependent methyltransferase [Streptomonospora sp. DSM 45055]